MKQRTNFPFRLNNFPNVRCSFGLILSLILFFSMFLAPTFQVFSQSPVVILSENWDDATSTRPWAYENNGWWNTSYNSLVDVSGHGKVLKVLFPEGTVGVESGLGDIRLSLDSLYKEVYLSWDNYIESGFDYGFADGSGGGKFFGGFCGGIRNNSPHIDLITTDGWTSKLMFNHEKAITYNYFKNSDYSYGYPGGPTAIPYLNQGSWHRITLRLKINDLGNENGIFEVFYDDTLTYSKSDEEVIVASCPNFLIQHIYLNCFWGGSGSDYASPKTQYMEFDNLVAYYYPPNSSDFRSGASESGRIINVPTAGHYQAIPPNTFEETTYTEASGTIVSHCAFELATASYGITKTSTIEIPGASYIDIDVTKFAYDSGILYDQDGVQILKIYEGTGASKTLKKTFQNGIYIRVPTEVNISGSSATIEIQAGRGYFLGFSLDYSSDGSGSGSNYSCGDFNASQDGIRDILTIPQEDGVVAKINFTNDSTNKELWWNNVYGSSSFPLSLENGITIAISCGTLNTGASGEPASIMPPKVGSTYNYIMKDDNVPVQFLISGLNPVNRYTFDCFASRDDASVFGDRLTYYVIGNDSVAINPIGNRDKLLTLPNIRPSASGEIIMTVSKDDQQVGYINAMIIYEIPASRLTITPIGHGDVTPGSGIYPKDTVLMISAIPDPGWIFDKWVGDIESTDSIVQLTMNSDKDLTARFINREFISKDTIAIINFTNSPDYDESGWINVYGSPSFPVFLDNGVDINITRGTLNPGPNGEPSTVFPNLVGGTYNYIMDGDNTLVNLTFSGLPSSVSYRFDIFVSRNKVTASGDRTTSFRIGTTNVSLNPIGNTDSILTVSNVIPNSSGEVVLEMSKRSGTYGYINALVITRDNYTGKKNIAVDDQIFYYPVPVTDYLNITHLPDDCIIAVYDVLGDKILQLKNETNSALKVNMEKLRSGIYVFRISDTTSIIKTFKIMKE